MCGDVVTGWCWCIYTYNIYVKRLHPLRVCHTYDGNSGHNYIAFNEFENRDMLQSDFHVGWKWVNRLAPHAFVNYWWENDDFI